MIEWLVRSLMMALLASFAGVVASTCDEGVCEPSAVDPFTWARLGERAGDVEAYLALEDEETRGLLSTLAPSLKEVKAEMEVWNSKYDKWYRTTLPEGSWDGTVLLDNDKAVVLNATTFCAPEQAGQMGVGSVAMCGGTVAMLLDCTGGERYDLYVGPRHAVVKVDTDCFWSMSLSPDGRALVYTKMTDAIGAQAGRAVALHIAEDGSTTEPQHVLGEGDVSLDYWVRSLSSSHFVVVEMPLMSTQVYIGAYDDFSLVQVSLPYSGDVVVGAVTDTFCPTPTYFAAGEDGWIVRVDGEGVATEAYAGVEGASVDGVWSCGCDAHPVARLRNFDGTTSLVQFTGERSWRTLRTSDNLVPAEEFWAGYGVGTLMRTSAASPLPVWETSGVAPPVECSLTCSAGRASLTCEDRGPDPFAVERGEIEGVPYYMVRPPVAPVGYLFEAYGAYGSTSRPSFAAYRLAMVALNYTLVQLNPRGSGIDRTSWSEGRGALKSKTFEDIAAVMRFFRDADPGVPTILHGWSAGGLAATATGLLYPELVDVVWGEAPFVDVTCAMRDPLDITSTYEAGEWSETCTASFDPMRLVKEADSESAPLMYIETSYEDIRVPCSQVARFGLMARAHSALPRLVIRARHGSHAAGHTDRARAETLTLVLHLVSEAKAKGPADEASADIVAIVAVTALVVLCVGACTWFACAERGRRRKVGEDGVPLVERAGE
jgi:pimeloyl-ACP methyl ester carboxylesterase